MILPVARTGVRDMTNRHVVLFFFLFFTWPFVSVHSACPLANHERAVKCRLDSNWVGTSLWRTCFRVYLLLSVESCAGHFFDMRLSLLLFLHSSVFILVGQKFFRKKKYQRHERGRRWKERNTEKSLVAVITITTSRTTDYYQLLPISSWHHLFWRALYAVFSPFPPHLFFSPLFSSSCCYYSPCPRGGLLCVKSCNVYARTRGSRLQKKKILLTACNQKGQKKKGKRKTFFWKHLAAIMLLKCLKKLFFSFSK